MKALLRCQWSSQRNCWKLKISCQLWKGIEGRKKKQIQVQLYYSDAKRDWNTMDVSIVPIKGGAHQKQTNAISQTYKDRQTHTHTHERARTSLMCVENKENLCRFSMRCFPDEFQINLCIISKWSCSVCNGSEKWLCIAKSRYDQLNNCIMCKHGDAIQYARRSSFVIGSNANGSRVFHLLNTEYAFHQLNMSAWLNSRN